MSIEAPTAPWVHIQDAKRHIAAAVADFSRRYKAPQQLRIAVRWPTNEDGCWCYARSPRPHPHVHELGGCPVNSAGDNYVALEISRDANSQECVCAETSIRNCPFTLLGPLTAKPSRQINPIARSESACK